MGKLLAAYLMPHPALLIPEIGLGEEKKLEKTAAAMQRIAKEIKELAPDNIIVMTPHGAAFMGVLSVFGGSVAQKTMADMEAPDIWLSLPTNQEFSRELKKACDARKLGLILDEQTGLDNGSFVPLYFISRELLEVRVSLLCPGFVSARDTEVYGDCVREAIKKSAGRFVIIASGDMSHMLSEDGPYGYSEQGMYFEGLIESIVESGDLSGISDISMKCLNEAGQCGLGSLRLAVNSIEKERRKGEMYSHEWPFGIGYLVASLVKKIK